MGAWVGAFTRPGITTRPLQSMVSAGSYSVATSPTARIVRPATATDPSGWTVNRSSSVTTWALVSRRSQGVRIAIADVTLHWGDSDAHALRPPAHQCPRRDAGRSVHGPP